MGENAGGCRCRRVEVQWKLKITWKVRNFRIIVCTWERSREGDANEGRWVGQVFVCRTKNGKKALNWTLKMQGRGQMEVQMENAKGNWDWN